MSSQPVLGLTITYKKSKGRKRGKKVKNQYDEAISSSGDSVTKEMRSKSYYGGHKSTILAILDRDRSEEDSFCDATLQVDGAKFRVHRCLLGGLSDYFKKMFKCEMKEKYYNTINLEKFNVETIQTILDYFYTAKITISEENAISLLEAADYFQLGDLKLFCAETLISSLTVMNCLHFRSVGDTFNCESLHLSSGEVVTKHFKKVIEQPMFKQLSSDDVESIIESLDQEAIGGRPVYEGILIWVSHDCERRREKFVKLFKLVKLHFLPTKYLEEKVFNQELVKSSNECKDHFLKESFHIMKHQNRKEPVFDSSSSNESSSNEDDGGSLKLYTTEQVKNVVPEIDEREIVANDKKASKFGDSFYNLRLLTPKRTEERKKFEETLKTDPYLWTPKRTEEPKKFEESFKNMTQKEQTNQENKVKDQNPKAPAYVPHSSLPKKKQKPKLQDPEFELATASTRAFKKQRTFNLNLQVKNRRERNEANVDI